MDLWIRSQEKNILQKVSKLYVTTYAEESGYGIYDINNVDDCDIPLGFYKTRERALEVLDEIQNILQPKMSVKPTIEEDMNPEYIHKCFVSNGKEVDIVEFNTYIYEMPKE